MLVEKAAIMKPRGNIISDLAQMANGAASALGTMRDDVQMMRQSRTERSQAASGMVTQEDFEAIMSLSLIHISEPTRPY